MRELDPSAGLTVVRTVDAVREHVRAARDRGGRVALVPTMGAFHDGHLSLIRAARAAADLVVVWLFVNPTQFNEAADLEAYPRDEARDARLAAEHGADVLFAPDVDEVYPEGFDTVVTVRGIGDVFEGEHRPGHFNGVATVVLKMINMAGPDLAVFGAKDAQQVALVKRMVRDLNVPVRIEVVPIVREHDGLAMSSRNVHLKGEDRHRALALHSGLEAARAASALGERDPVRIRTAVETVMRDLGVEPEYVAVVDPDSFTPVDRVDGHALVAVAARVGPTRLIDNTSIPPSRPTPEA